MFWSLILIIGSLFTVGAMFRPSIGRSLNNFIQGGANLAQFAWSRFWPLLMWAFIWYTILLSLILGGIGILLWSSWPYYLAILPFSILSFGFWTLGVVLKAFSKNPSGLIASAKGTLSLIRGALAGLCILLAFVMAFAAIPHSVKRLSGNLWTGAERSMDETSANIEAGHFGETKEQTAIFNSKGQLIIQVPAGKKVKVLSTKTFLVDENSEGLLKVMLPNEAGKFIKGRVGYMPTRDIALDTKSANAQPTSKRAMLAWHKDPNKDGIDKNARYKPIPVAISHFDESFIEFESINGGPKCIFTATKDPAQKTYSGHWSQQSPRDGGKFELTFHDGSTGEGELWDRLGVKFSITLRRL